MTTDYVPIDCDQHSVLVLLAMRRARVIVQSRRPEGRVSIVEAMVCDVLTPAGRAGTWRAPRTPACVSAWRVGELLGDLMGEVQSFGATHIVWPPDVGSRGASTMRTPAG